MSLPKCALVVAVAAAFGLLSARIAMGDEAAAKPAPAAADMLAWDDSSPGGPPRLDDQPPPGPPRDGDRDRPPGPSRPPRDPNQPPPRFGDASGRQPPGPPRDGDQRPPRDGEGRPGPDGMRQPGPPRWPPENWQSLEKNDPDMYKLVKEDMELDHQSRELASLCRQAPQEQRDEMKKQLQKLVNKQFEVRQARRTLEVKRVETEIQRLRDAIDRRNGAREKIVAQRVSDLLGVEGEMSF